MKRTAPSFALGITDEYCPPIGKSLLLLTVEYARNDLRSTGSPFPFAVAVVSLMLDVSSGKVLSQREYADLWGWTRQETRTRWDALKAAMLCYATAYGRLQGDEKIAAFCANPELTQSQPSANPKNEEITEESPNANPELTQSQPSANHPTIEQENKEQENKKRESTRKGSSGRGRKKPDPTLPTTDEALEALVMPESLRGNAAFAAVWRRWVAHRLTLRPPTDWIKGFQRQLDYAATWDVGYISHVIAEAISRGSWENFYPKPQEQQAYLRGITQQGAAGNTPSNGGAVPVDSWWLMDYHKCLDEATREGLTGQPKHWPKFRNSDGKVYWVKPQNVSRGIPATFTPIDAES